MSFLDHLEDLRWHLIRCVIAVCVLAVAAFTVKDLIFDTIIFAPKDPNFVTYRMMCKVAEFFQGPDANCITNIPFEIQNRKMAGQFNAHIWTSIITGLIVAFPYVLYELWRFISPGLKAGERKASRGFIFVGSLLFFTGVLFGYYVLAPLSINFLSHYVISEKVHNIIDISSYMSLMRMSVLASGIVFELPILMYILSKIGLVTPEALIKYRKIAIVVILILAAVITPPDVISQVIVAIPILILYEVSIFISKIVTRKRKKKLGL